MAEYTNASATVDAGQNIPFTETAVQGCDCIQHREGSGTVTLRGITNRRKAKFQVNYSGNIAIPAGGTVAPISVAIAVDGEPLTTAIGIVTPAAAGDFFNVSIGTQILVPCGSSSTVAVENTSGAVITAQNNNLIVDRIDKEAKQ